MTIILSIAFAAIIILSSEALLILHIFRRMERRAEIKCRLMEVA